MSFPRYAEYKDSGVEWLGEIPSGWEMIRLRYLLNDGYDGLKIGPFGSQLTSDMLKDDGLFKVYGQENIISSNFTKGNRFIDDSKFEELSVYKIKTGDILITMMGTSGRCDVVPVIFQSGIMDSHLLRIRVNNRIKPNFLQLLIDKSHYLKQQIRLAGKGSIMHGLNSSIIKDLIIILPPISEQTQIAAFLDHETAKLDNLINEQKKLIDLLKEKRQAVISHAVTKGLNPNAPMKDSGVEWLGKVPEGWGVLTAKRISKIFVPQRNKPQLNTTADGISWVTMEDMKTSEIITTNLWVTEEEAKIAGSKILPKGAVISSCVGNFGVASINMIDVIINQQLQAFIPSHNINPIFLLHCIRCAKSYFEKIGTAATLIYVNQQGFENMPLAVPPQKEQELIVAFLDQETTKIDTLITKAESAIQLLQERRTALISAAVTGKIDVRGFVKT